MLAPARRFCSGFAAGWLGGARGAGGIVSAIFAQSGDCGDIFTCAFPASVGRILEACGRAKKSAP